jgi:hypothetical protein
VLLGVSRSGTPVEGGPGCYWTGRTILQGQWGGRQGGSPRGPRENIPLTVVETLGVFLVIFTETGTV